ncbi:MAG: hypothetical protein ACO1OB_19530 [Archangium sp.]
MEGEREPLAMSLPDVIAKNLSVPLRRMNPGLRAAATGALATFTTRQETVLGGADHDHAWCDGLMARSALLILMLGGCVTSAPVAPQYSAAAISPAVRTLFDASPQIIPVRIDNPYTTTLQAAVFFGFTPVQTDASAGMMVLSREEVDEYETDLDADAAVHVRKLTITIVLNRQSATLSPSVSECIEPSATRRRVARRECRDFDGLIEPEATLLKQLMNVLDPPSKRPPVDATSL